MILKLEITKEYEFEIEVDYTPERPAPPCSDHDSPRFSDPGCDEEILVSKITMFIPGGGKVDMTKYLKDHIDIEDEARDEYRRESIPL